MKNANYKNTGERIYIGERLVGVVRNNVALILPEVECQIWRELSEDNSITGYDTVEEIAYVIEDLS